MMHPGSLDNGDTDVEYTPNPDHRLSAQELWFRACDKRISSLELQVHRMLNPEPHSDEWQLMPEYLHGYTDGRAAVTKTEGDYVHVPAPEWEALKEELEDLREQQQHHFEMGRTTTAFGTIVIGIRKWKEMLAELDTLRAARPDMDEEGVTLSHDAYNALERQAAIGRSVPVEEINVLRMAMAQIFRDNIVIWPSTRMALYAVEKWLGEPAPEEAAE